MYPWLIHTVISFIFAYLLNDFSLHLSRFGIFHYFNVLPEVSCVGTGLVKSLVSGSVDDFIRGQVETLPDYITNKLNSNLISNIQLQI